MFYQTTQGFNPLKNKTQKNYMTINQNKIDQDIVSIQKKLYKK